MTYNGKYSKKMVLSVKGLLDEGMDIRSITELTGVPETTIRNWKLGYTKLYRRDSEFNEDIKRKVLHMARIGISMPEISRELKINYNKIRLFLIGSLPSDEYQLLKILDRKLPEKAKVVTKELSYILGVLYGDGYFGPGQIRLGTKDKEFADFFSSTVKTWCGKRPSQAVYTRNSKPYFETYLGFKEAADFIKTIVGARDQIPTDVLQSTDVNVLRFFVLGFCDSEGSIIINNHHYRNIIRMYNKNKLVLDQLRTMMITLGFDSKRLSIIINKKTETGPVYALHMGDRQQLKLFYDKVGFSISRKQEKLEIHLRNKQLL